jgi:ParB family chromosome partitioning protein
MAKMKGLGRGLDALLSGDKEDVAAKDTVATLNVALLQPGKYQPRTHMDQESLAQLAESIKAQGIMQPILVRRVGDNRYEIIAGERRWRAARMSGLEEVPVLVREVQDDVALAMALIENIQRENLNPLEEATGIQRLIDEFKMTHQQASDAVGRSRSAVTNMLRLLNLAEPVQDLLMQNRLDMGHARALLAVGSAAKQTQLAHEVAEKQLSVRETERLVQRILHPIEKAPVKVDRDTERLQEDLSDKLGAPVTIKAGTKGSGKLIIEYSNLDQLDAIIGRF